MYILKQTGEKNILVDGTLYPLEGKPYPTLKKNYGDKHSSLLRGSVELDCSIGLLSLKMSVSILTDTKASNYKTF